MWNLFIKIYLLVNFKYSYEFIVCEKWLCFKIKKYILLGEWFYKFYSCLGSKDIWIFILFFIWFVSGYIVRESLIIY